MSERNEKRAYDFFVWDPLTPPGVIEGVLKIRLDRLTALLDEVEREQRALLKETGKALEKVSVEINRVAPDLGAQFPALAEAWMVAGVALAKLYASGVLED